jgi:hypothetical protein
MPDSGHQPQLFESIPRQVWTSLMIMMAVSLAGFATYWFMGPTRDDIAALETRLGLSIDTKLTTALRYHPEIQEIEDIIALAIKEHESHQEAPLTQQEVINIVNENSPYARSRVFLDEKFGRLEKDIGSVRQYCESLNERTTTMGARVESLISRFEYEFGAKKN